MDEERSNVSPIADSSDSKSSGTSPAMCMAVVPWTYNNPRVDRKACPTQQFTFGGHVVEILQDPSAEISVHQNTELKLWDGAYLLAKFMETGMSEELRTRKNNSSSVIENTSNSRELLEKIQSTGCSRTQTGHGAVIESRIGHKTQDSKNVWTGRRCIELGAGCGLVGTVVWLLGAEVVLTDLPDALRHTEKCLQHNLKRLGGTCHKGSIRTASLSWGSDCQHLNPPFDCIIGSDIVYQKEYIPDLLMSMSELSSDDTVIYISYKPRGLGENIFFEELGKHSFVYSIVPPEEYPIEFKGSDYEILRIVKANEEQS